MHDLDLNLLKALDALLAERSVTQAAHRLGLSVSAMSRNLTRLRKVTGDRLLVQAGRQLVPTPYAQGLTERVHDITRSAYDLLQPAQQVLNLAMLERSFTLKAMHANPEYRWLRETIISVCQRKADCSHPRLVMSSTRRYSFTHSSDLTSFRFALCLLSPICGHFKYRYVLTLGSRSLAYVLMLPLRATPGYLANQINRVAHEGEALSAASACMTIQIPTEEIIIPIAICQDRGSLNIAHAQIMVTGGLRYRMVVTRVAELRRKQIQ